MNLRKEDFTPISKMPEEESNYSRKIAEVFPSLKRSQEGARMFGAQRNSRVSAADVDLDHLDPETSHEMDENISCELE